MANIGTNTATYMFMASDGVSSRGIYKAGSRIMNVNGYATNDIMGFAYDADANTMQFYRNGATYGSKITGVPSSASLVYGNPQGADLSDCTVHHVNFGQQPFKHGPPAGFKAFNSFTHSSLRIS
jgi:hypothetical protein